MITNKPCIGKRILAGVVMLATSLAIVVTTTHSQQPDHGETGAQALKDGKFPWYSSESNSVQSVESSNKQSAASANRNSIAVQPPRPTVNRSTITDLLHALYEKRIWLTIALIIAIAALSIWFYMRFKTTGPDRQNGRAQDRESMEDRIQELPFTLPQSSNLNFEERARDAADHGDYTEAMMLLFSFVLLSLDRKGIIRLHRGTTNRQYLRQIRSHDHLPTVYKKIMIPFEESFFGGHHIDQITFEQCWNQIESFRNILR